MLRGALAAGTAALAACLTTLPAHASGSLALSVVACPTTLGVAQPLPKRPRTLHVTLSSRYGSLLEGYSNGYLTALGPRGWHCRGQVGADGSAVLDVTPGRSSATLGAAAVTVQFADTPGVAAGFACSVFHSAVAQLPVKPCPVTRPKRELLLVVSTTTVAFEDPRGVHGLGLPSGGPYAANGVITYTPSSRTSNGYALIETCTLAPSSHGLCPAILDNIYRAG